MAGSASAGAVMFESLLHAERDELHEKLEPDVAARAESWGS